MADSFVALMTSATGSIPPRCCWAIQDPEQGEGPSLNPATMWILNMVSYRPKYALMVVSWSGVPGRTRQHVYYFRCETEVTLSPKLSTFVPLGRAVALL